MRLISVFFVAVAAVCRSAVCHAAPEETQPVYTNQSRFRIPYHFNAEEMRKIGAKEIRLYFSVDLGVRWKHIQSVTPVAGRFDFQAPGDGEYWFAVRTVDAQNQLHPREATIQPGLKVIVDTKQPQLSISLKQPQPGTVQLEWSASDPHLDAESLQLEYIQSGWTNWKRVAVSPQNSGRTSWKVLGGGLVAVRGQISDNASNVATAQNRVEISLPEGRTPKPSAPDFSKPIASSTDRPGQSQGDLQLPSQTAIQPNPDANSLPPLPTDPVSSQETFSSEFPIPAGPEGPFFSSDSSPGTQLDSGTPETGSVSERPEIRKEPVTAQAQSRPAAENSRTPGPATTRRSYRIGDNTRVVNNRKFQIGYRIDDVGPSGISRVELFITQDNGKKWYKYGNDADQTSPFEVEVPRDGRYGFTLRASNGLGLASQPPQPGERPSIDVIVDNTPPVVELYPVQQGRGAQLNKISIRWKVTDEYPTDKPVLLSYSTDPTGPWEPISGWMNNTGNYLWTAGPRVPSRLYIRLTARDAAGNTTRTATTDPLIVDLSRPAARIVDVESIETSPRR